MMKITTDGYRWKRWDQSIQLNKIARLYSKATGTNRTDTDTKICPSPHDECPTVLSWEEGRFRALRDDGCGRSSVDVGWPRSEFRTGQHCSGQASID